MSEIEDRQQVVSRFNALRNAIYLDPGSEDVGRCFEAFVLAYRGPTRKFVVAFAPMGERRHWVGELFVQLIREIAAEEWNTSPPPPPC